MIQLKVARMNCGGCAKSVRRAVLGVDPGARVDIDLGEGIVSVVSSSEAVRIADAIRSTGYGAEFMDVLA